MKKIIIIASIVLLSVSSGFAQSIWSVNYNLSVPAGDLADFIKKTSPRGFEVNGNWFITDNVTLGGSLNWVAFGEKNERNTYQLEDGAITGTNWNRLYTVPFKFNSFYHFLPEGNIQPYVGAGIGTYYVQQELQVGRYVQTNKNWKMGIAPELGAYFPLGRGGYGINAKVAYNMVFYNIENINNLSYISFSVGFSVFN